MPETRERIELPTPESAISLAGPQEENLKFLADRTGARLIMRGQELFILGQPNAVERCCDLIRALEPYWCEGKALGRAELQMALQARDSDRLEDLQALQRDVLARTRRGEAVRAKTFRQRQYVQAIRSHDITFGVGPAGTGKTYLAAVVAVQALLAGDYERLILTRPAVEAGERLGFLPGDLQQKVDPFLRPLYDALYEFIDPEKLPELMERGVVEVAPLAYMRGRTLNNCFAIVDEAQNTTPAQIKMMLTRLGFGSRMTITGDLSQTDLPSERESGLSVALRILESVPGIAICRLTAADVVRHPLVQEIVAAYERYENRDRPRH